LDGSGIAGSAGAAELTPSQVIGDPLTALAADASGLLLPPRTNSLGQAKSAHMRAICLYLADKDHPADAVAEEKKVLSVWMELAKNSPVKYSPLNPTNDIPQQTLEAMESGTVWDSAADVPEDFILHRHVLLTLLP